MNKGNAIFSALALTALLTGTTILAAPSVKRNASSHKTDLTAQESKREETRERKSQSQEQLAREAKISMEQAREIALKRAPGKVESGELERERGRLVYSFDIRNAKGTITEVQVSAIKGKVVRVEHETKKHEAAEKRQEKREQH